MKKLALLVVLAVACMLVGCNQNAAQTGPKIGVVDQGKVFENSASGKAAVAYLEMVSKDMQEDFKKLQEAVQKDNSQENMAKMQQAVAQFQQRMGAEQQMVLGKLDATLKDVLETYRKEKKLDVILSVEQALAYGDSADITADITTAMDKITLNFAPVVPAEKPQAANGEANEKEAAPKEAGQAKQ